jgi:hypothetical protein
MDFMMTMAVLGICYISTHELPVSFSSLSTAKWEDRIKLKTEDVFSDFDLMDESLGTFLKFTRAFRREVGSFVMLFSLLYLLSRASTGSSNPTSCACSATRYYVTAVSLHQLIQAQAH